jgi:hypothetical protein
VSEGLLVSLLVLAVLLGVGSAAVLVIRSPSFWVDLAKEIAVKAWPQIKQVLTKRMTPEEEAEMRREQRAGRGDEWLKKWHRRKR